MKTLTIQLIENCRVKEEQTFKFDTLQMAIKALKYFISIREQITGRKHYFNQPQRCWDIPDCCGDGLRFILNADLQSIFKANEFIQAQ